jgi:ribose operon repressor, lacI family
MRMGALAAEILFDIIETKETVRPPVRVVGETIWRQSVTALK